MSATSCLPAGRSVSVLGIAMAIAPSSSPWYITGTLTSAPGSRGTLAGGALAAGTLTPGSSGAGTLSSDEVAARS
jgi:hypothetical protein